MTTEADRLQLLYELNRRLATFTDLDELLTFTTGRVRDLLEAEGCAVLVHDRDTDELYFPIASQQSSSAATPQRLREARFPASQGISGWVLRHGQAVSVEDVAADPRFYRGVDASTGTTTRSILCAPLRSDAGVRGVMSVVNPGVGTGPDHLRFLEAIASDVVVAFERAAEHTRLAGEAAQARSAGRIAGACLVALGIAIVAGGVLAQGAVGLPLRHLVLRPAPWVGTAVALMGGILLRVMRPTA